MPYRVLEELLVCVGRGPVVWVTNPAFAGGSNKKDVSAPPSAVVASSSSALVLPPARIQVTNASYLVAARVLRRAEDKISSPIAALLNGLLARDLQVSYAVRRLTSLFVFDNLGKKEVDSRHCLGG